MGRYFHILWFTCIFPWIIVIKLTWYSVQFSHSVMSNFLYPMDCSTPGLLVHHQLTELAQTHPYQVSDAIQPSHPLLSPSPPTFNLSQHQFSSVSQSCLILCDPMDCRMPNLPDHHQFLEFTQTHVHRVSDAVQQSHPLSSLSPDVNLSQHQGLLQ